MLIELSPQTVVAEGTHLQGSFNFSSRVQILGLIEGDVHQTSTEDLVIGKTGWIQGSIASRGAIVVAGRVDGDVNSLCAIRLLPSAKVNGTIRCSKVSIEPGASLEGDVVMQWANASTEPELLAA